MKETGRDTFPGCEYTREQVEFLLAVDRWKREKRRPFPTLCEYLFILTSLGYRKAPLENRTMDSFNFDSLAPQETPVTIEGKKYVLREPSEAAALRYRDACIRGAKMEDGVVTMGAVAEAQPLLVSLCLFEIISEQNGEPKNVGVSLQTIKGWPTRVVKPLFEAAKEMGGLNEGTPEELEKAIAKLQKQLAKARTKDDAEKNS